MKFNNGIFGMLGESFLDGVDELSEQLYDKIRREQEENHLDPLKRIALLSAAVILLVNKVEELDAKVNVNG